MDDYYNEDHPRSLTMEQVIDLVGDQTSNVITVSGENYSHFRAITPPLDEEEIVTVPSQPPTAPTVEPIDLADDVLNHVLDLLVVKLNNINAKRGFGNSPLVRVEQIPKGSKVYGTGSEYRIFNHSWKSFEKRALSLDCRVIELTNDQGNVNKHKLSCSLNMGLILIGMTRNPIKL